MSHTARSHSRARRKQKKRAAIRRRNQGQQKVLVIHRGKGTFDNSGDMS